MNPYVLRWEAGDFLFHRYEKPFWKDIDSEEVLEVGDVAKKLNSLEAQVEALQKKLAHERGCDECWKEHGKFGTCGSDCLMTDARDIWRDWEADSD